ncbi:MAG TPA: lytic transglycosylase domain-containing protein [Chitinophagaceae bacterium]
MLKRKLDKAGLIALSFLFIAATPNTRIKSSQITRNDHVARHAAHAFDSNGLCVCLPELSEEKMLTAPRIELNRQASVFTKSYLKENGFFLEKVKTKSDRIFTIIDTIFTRYELPLELKYLAVIESKLNPVAQSKVGATGLWQFMASSGRTFGLKVSGSVDERKNSYKSTVAAAKCLVYLNNIFDDWLLTLAAYNSGPGKVLSAIKKSGSRNFWVLQSYLPLETRNHVKRFISTHYFFEGHGSLVTMTKAETKAHINAVADFVSKQEELLKTDSSVVETESAPLL